MIINWYPGHMASAKRMLAENIKICDAVILVLDARIPLSSRNPDLDRLAQGKPTLTVLNKTDLADPKYTRIWVNSLCAAGETVLEVSNKSNKRADILSALDRITRETRQKAAQRGMKKTIRVMVAGIPNSGKSTLINTLAGAGRTKTGDKAGVTRGKQWIALNDYLEILDSPGLLWPRLDNQTFARRLAFTGAINDEILADEELAVALTGELASRYPRLLNARYSVTPQGAPEEIFADICLKRGLLQKGGVPDLLRGAAMLKDEFRAGKIGRITLDIPAQESTEAAGEE